MVIRSYRIAANIDMRYRMISIQQVFTCSTAKFKLYNHLWEFSEYCLSLTTHQDLIRRHDQRITQKGTPKL
jgi:hypothetical protein